MDETVRKRSARRSRIISAVYTEWMAELREQGTLEAVTTASFDEENGELAALTSEAETELNRRTEAALRQAGL